MSGGRPTGLKQVASGERVDVVAAIGGWRGVVDGAAPTILFVVVYTVVQELRPPLIAALATSGVLVLLRLVTRQPVQAALGGLVGVAASAYLVTRTGRAEDFFALGLLVNVVYAAAYAISIAVRWPLLGVFVGPITGEGFGWRQDPPRLRAYSRASWIWVGLFLTRLAVQGPLYLAGAVGALGTARLVMGFPFFGLAVWLSWLVLRRVPAATPGVVATAPPQDGHGVEGGADEGAPAEGERPSA